VSHRSRHVELDIDIGADAKDWLAVQATEKLKPVETELRRIEEMVGEIVAEMEYLRSREQKLRDTNESTNTRVKWFAFGTMGMLVALGAWQVVYLRAYFRYSALASGAGRLANVLQGQSILFRSSCDFAKEWWARGVLRWRVLGNQPHLVLLVAVEKQVYNGNTRQVQEMPWKSLQRLLANVR
jgi:hypothetical protein